MITVGSLCSGYEGIGLGLELLFDVDLAFVAEIDPGASRVLSARLPAVPNLGDLTQVAWANRPRVDLLAAGFPCQDISRAGLRAGIQPSTRSGLWYNVASVIDAMR